MANGKELVEEIAKALVTAPDEVEVREAGSPDAPTIELRVAAADLGKMIGKQGRTARSMRTLLNAMGSKVNRHYTLDIIEE